MLLTQALASLRPAIGPGGPGRSARWLVTAPGFPTVTRIPYTRLLHRMSGKCRTAGPRTSPGRRFTYWSDLVTRKRSAGGDLDGAADRVGALVGRVVAVVDQARAPIDV